jgi:hypothetical protein
MHDQSRSINYYEKAVLIEAQRKAWSPEKEGTHQ